ncbi:S-layer homology domain-containing protein [Rossellomorea sp. NPDC077527]|uniref:S-layer homology domain-containing protein n=1 Tax=Rossellomorea sp. NPDC077527 TaxID=3364510 RepID=UPI0037C7AC1A
MKAFKLLICMGLALVAMPLQSVFAAGGKTIDHYIPMDIDEDHWAWEEIDDFINADIIDGYMDSDMNMTVKPSDKVTRAQFTKILVKALSLEINGTPKTFKDVKSSAWYYDSVNIASSLGIINGKQDGTFAPNDYITRDQMTKMIVLAFEKTVKFPAVSTQTFSDVKKDFWAFDYINKAAGSEIVNGYGANFKPLNRATRAEAIVMVHRGLAKEQSNLPDEEAVKEFLKAHILKENSLVESNSYDKLMDLYEMNGTGYYLTEARELGGMGFPDEEGYTIEIDDSKLNLETLSISDRFITIEATGMVGRFIFKSDDFNMDFTSDMDGAYNLKLDSESGKWKIYNYFPYFDEEEFVE